MQQNKFSRFREFLARKKVAKKSKKLFWVWIAYQTIKGTLTTSLIWIPMLYMWLHHK